MIENRANTYNPLTTGIKAAPPVAVVAIVETLCPVLQAHGVDIDRAFCYSVLMGSYAVYLAVSNWLKNRKKK